MWRKKGLWRQLLLHQITQKVNESSFIRSFTPQEEESSVFGKLKNLISTKEPESPKSQNTREQTLTVAYSVLAQFITYFVHFGYPKDQSKDLILGVCSQYKMDNARTHILLSDLESMLISSYDLTFEDKLLISTSRRARHQHRYGPFLPIALVIPYINSDACLGKLLGLSKLSHKVLRR